MSATIDIRDLPNRIQEALALTAAGSEVILLDGNTPRARIVPLETARERIADLHPGAIVPSSDFDAPLPDEFWLGQP